MFDISNFVNVEEKALRYKRRIDQLIEKGQYVDSIEKTVSIAVSNIFEHKSRSFVIYGEPQSGKTEMMIALTARMLDEGFKIVVVLLNDSVQLLNQNLERFRRSDINPSPKNFSEILDSSVHIGESEWIIFCKKNSKDLQKLIGKLHGHQEKIIIDDEADYASPNAKINKGEQTRINGLIEEVLGAKGVYVGVTATPARLDLNNTFENQNDKWIDFLPHPEYTGQDVFFPMNYDGVVSPEFNLELLPDEDDSPIYLREAMFKFFINVAHLNLASREENYSMLVHTSGKKADHTEDYRQIIKVLNILKNSNHKSFENYVKRIWEITKEKYEGKEDVITKYIVQNISRNVAIVMNSDADKNTNDYGSAINPATLFTIIIGGNIVSRGVTFDNLLSMFFTRDVKHKIQQDTYIQRARMFGSRGNYLKAFNLHIPKKLYLDWHRCFVFHRLSLASIKSGKGAPVWLEDNRVSAAASSSIDKTTVDMNSGEMGFEVFGYTESILNIITATNMSNFEILTKLSENIGDDSLPAYLLNFIKPFMPNGNESIAFHGIRVATKEYKEKLDRPKGVLGGDDFKKFPIASHHILVYKNSIGRARIIYAYKGNIRTLKNKGRNG